MHVHKKTQLTKHIHIQRELREMQGLFQRRQCTPHRHGFFSLQNSQKGHHLLHSKLHSWMPVDHKLCSGLDPVGENLLSSLKKPPSTPNRRWLKPERRPRPAPEAESETLAPFLELGGCSSGEGMTLPRRETPLSTRGIRDTSRRILTQFIFSLFSAQSLPLSLPCVM